MATLLDLDINVDAIIKDTQKAYDEIQQLNDNLKELKKQGEENSAEFIKTQAQLKATQKEYNQNKKTLSELTAIQGKNITTVKQARTALSAVSAEWARVTKIEGENSAESKKLAAQKLQLTERLKELEKATGDNRRNVGNYGASIKKLGGIIAGVGVGVTAAIGIFNKFKDILFSNQEIADKFEKTMAGLKARFDVLKDRATGVISGQIKLKDAMKGVGEEMRTEAEAARQLVEETQDLRDSTIDTVVEKARLNREIAKAQLASKDETLTFKERIAQQERAIKLEEQLLDLNLKEAKERARISQEQIDLGNSTAEELMANAELQAQVIELETASFTRRKELYSERTSLLNQQRAEEVAAEKAKQDEILKNEAELQKEREEKEKLALEQKKERDALEAESEYQLKLERAETEYERRQLELEKQYQQEIAAAERVGADTTAITERYNLQKMALDVITFEERANIASQFLGNISAIFGEGTKIGKAAAIAQVSVDSAKGAYAAFTSFLDSAIPAPFNIAAGIVAAASVAAQGVRTIQKIRSMNPKSPSTSAGRISVGGAASVSKSATAQSDQNASIKNSFDEAIQKNPPVLVIEDVENKQGQRVQVQDRATF